ncbi:MAG TPA: 3-deoxy-7-phosphoheptulonate synthase [Candidatus Hydrogenedentes bacterium]|nr:3-deoxy-7-phosphoheptulonate synthase [Candidatus Hydrogenedentota bacterium]HNT88706.1 3-deoxy-7-phosphoheptulonate synthase [Candidatus Hydrogenedentota bacterium]
MIIVMASRNKEDVDHVVSKVEELGYKAHVIVGVERTVIAAVGDERGKHRLQTLEAMPHVERVVPILKPFKLAGREVRHEDSVIEIGPVKIGGGHFCVFAGPCAVESREQLFDTAKAVKEAGAHVLRGGAFKPRTSPYSFQGLEEKGLVLLEEAGKTFGLPVVTEIMTIEQLPLVERYADALQIGARNMQNYGLLKAVGKSRKPVFLKRGIAATINELLMSAEYIVSEGNPNVILCERGIRTFETETRNTLDIQAVPVLKRYTHLPVVIDPSHASGHWDLVPPMAKAAVAAGADGLMIEVHPHPEDAVSDGEQSLRLERFAELMRELEALIKLVGKTT